jgi:hypothetical protein
LRAASRAHHFSCGGGVGTAIVLGHHVDIVVIPPAIRLLVLDANVWKMHLVIEVREVALKRPLPDLLVGPIRVAVS